MDNLIADKIDVTVSYPGDEIQIILKGDSLRLYRFAKQLHEKADEDSIFEANVHDMRVVKFTHTIPFN